MSKPPIKSKYIESPEELLRLFDEYVISIKENPIKVNDWVGGQGKKVVRVKERALTMVGFENYCFRQGVIKDLRNYFANTDNAYDAYRSICSHIRGIIQQDQIEGGMAGIYNPSITQRLNGLKEATTNEVQGGDIPIQINYVVKKVTE